MRPPVVAGLLGSGLLGWPAPPRVIRPRASAIAESDDDALEADVLAAPAGRAG